jgi:hypothetical protein
VYIIKSVPNLISYLHKFFRNFSQFLAIYFELFSSGVIYFNSENADAWGPPISSSVAPRRALIGCCGRRCPNAPGGLKVASTAPFGRPLSEHMPELTDRAAAQAVRPRRFISPSEPQLFEAACSPCPKPSPSRPSRRHRRLHRRAGECVTPPAFLVSPSTLTLSPGPIARRRATDVHARRATRCRRRVAPPSTCR